MIKRLSCDAKIVTAKSMPVTIVLWSSREKLCACCDSTNFTVIAKCHCALGHKSLLVRGALHTEYFWFSTLLHFALYDISGPGNNASKRSVSYNFIPSTLIYNAILPVNAFSRYGLWIALTNEYVNQRHSACVQIQVHVYISWKKVYISYEGLRNGRFVIT